MLSFSDLQHICFNLVTICLKRNMLDECYQLFEQTDCKMNYGSASDVLHPLLYTLFSSRHSDKSWFYKAEKVFLALSREEYYPKQDYPSISADNCYLMIERSFTNADIYMVIVMYLQNIFER